MNRKEVYRRQNESFMARMADGEGVSEIEGGSAV